MLFELHADALYRYLARLSGDADLAADAVQETFARYMRHAPADAHARFWLFRVGTNIVREWTRTRARRNKLLQTIPAPAVLGDAPPQPDAQLDRKRIGQLVRAALDRLPERERTLLLMREAGFTHREMAEATGTTTKSVGSMLARALTRLARELPLAKEGQS